VEEYEAFLTRMVPFDPSRGEEGVSTQGTILIGLLVLIGLSAWKGFNNIYEGFNAFTWIALGLTSVTLLVAALGIAPENGGLAVRFTGKFFGVLLGLVVLGYLLRTSLTEEELRDWLWESWRFVKQIFPLLVVGVFFVGVARVFIQPEWVQRLAGENTILGNLAGVAFGIFMYFPTLVEVPIANMFLDLGMHRGPLLAYLMADPELSLQSILIIIPIIGRLKAWAYVGWVALFSTLAGLIYGAWVDGTEIGWIIFYLISFLGVLALALFFVNKRVIHKIKPQATSS
jgi:hypothetical protein